MSQTPAEKFDPDLSGGRVRPAARLPVRLASRLMVDITPLRSSPAFRRLWIGGGLSGLGGQMTGYAVILQVYQLTRSSLAVGLVGLFTAVPLIAVSVLGGVIVDAADRRKTVLVATSVQAAVSAALAVQAFAGFGQVWLLYCLVVLQSAVAGVNAPARRAFIPGLLSREQLPAGAALQMVAVYVTLLAGPAIAGLITAAFHLRICYLVDVVSFAFSLYAVARLPAMRPAGQDSARRLRAIGEGLRFIAGTRAILGVLLADMSATFLGMPTALFPAINAERFGGHPQTLGLMTTAVAAGGLLGSALSGPAGRIRRQGLGMLTAGAVWGASLAAFGLSGSFWLAFLTLAVAGAADVTSVVLRTALVQSLTPDRLLGRVSAADLAVGAGVPQLGNFRAGAVASLTSPTISAVSGGLAAAAGVILTGLLIPDLVTFRTQGPRTLPHQAAA